MSAERTSTTRSGHHRTAALVAAAILAGFVSASESASSAAISPEDREIERYLTEGQIVDEKEIPVGITRPLKLTLELDGRTMLAVFKAVDIMNSGKTDFPDGTHEMNFVDSYKNDRAAYLLDRQLGLNMVPVVVLRRYKGKNGAMVQWISDAISERDRLEQNVAPDDFRVLSRQQELMRLFDALILNMDANQTNMLYTKDWKLHLIDHSRSFRTRKQLPDAFRRNPVTLNRELLARLEALDEKQLKEMLRGVVPKAKVRSLMVRRDRILEKIAADRAEFGDWIVFPDDAPRPTE